MIGMLKLAAKCKYNSSICSTRARSIDQASDPVHCIDLLSKSLYAHIPFQFLAGSQHAVLLCEWLGVQVDLLDAFEAVELVGGGQLIEGFKDEFVDFATVANLILARAHLALFLLPDPLSGDLEVGDDDSDEVRLERVAVDVDLRHEARLHVHVLQFLRRDVLALRQLEDVLGPVYDFNATIGKYQADISRQEPAIDERLSVLLLVHEIALEDGRPLEADFTSRVWPVTRRVPHLRNISQPDLQARKWAANMARD